ncbi:MAG: hypothetical protein Q8N53_11990 [Longimicrobiales bacterium]|nr:hypothetical protein [Longimicrobiales bacterium]
MSPVRTARAGLLLVVVATLAACGGSSDGNSASMPTDTFIKTPGREPLTETDLAGIAPTELSLELPWTQNQVIRNAAAGAPAASIQGAEVVAHEAFDRVTFLLDASLPLPGYEISLAAAGSPLTCGAQPLELTAGRTLVVRFAPARANAEGETWLPVRMANTTASRMTRAGVACDDGTTMVWVAELAQGGEVRVLELREPSRIAVDVR